MGPLKMAAMNGLTMSRPMVLALMNDESRAPKDERVGVITWMISGNKGSMCIYGESFARFIVHLGGISQFFHRFERTMYISF